MLNAAFLIQHSTFYYLPAIKSLLAVSFFPQKRNQKARPNSFLNEQNLGFLKTRFTQTIQKSEVLP
jgi:hypothetical protein